MLRDIISDIMAAFADKEVDHVYSAFDARAVARKGSSYFTVVGISSFESTAPIYSQYTVFVPFRAEIEINVTAPEKFSMVQLLGYYDEKIDPVIRDMDSMTCRLKSMDVRFDRNIQRLVLKVKFSAGGISSAERSVS